jgi:uncharacterized protein (DUF169 family)
MVDLAWYRTEEELFMDYRSSATKWKQALDLRREPVGVAFVEQPPTGVQRSPEPAPSACTFWRRGQAGTFYATADDHQNCPIGLMTMGFPLSAEQGARAQDLVGKMAALHYFDPSEVAHVPGIRKPHSAVVYGPLAELPVRPDLVLLMLDARQSMLAAEALGRVTWAESTQLGAFGRPACAALPRAENLGEATLSLGCIGARTYTDMTSSEMLLAVPGKAFHQATQRLAVIGEANDKLAVFHAEQRHAIDPA